MSVTDRSGEAAGGRPRRRRRVWTEDEKRRIVAETFAPGASVSIVARRHDLNANMLFTWRRQLGSTPVTGDTVVFVPAAIAPEFASPEVSASRLVGRIEIILAGGDRVIVGADVDAAALARVVKVLSRR